jgi:hypothetical protein
MEKHVLETISTDIEEVCSRCFGVRSDTCCGQSKHGKPVAAAVVPAPGIGEEATRNDMAASGRFRRSRLKLAGEVIAVLLGVATLAIIMASANAPALFSGLL